MRCPAHWADNYSAKEKRRAVGAARRSVVVVVAGLVHPGEIVQHEAEPRCEDESRHEFVDTRSHGLLHSMAGSGAHGPLVIGNAFLRFALFAAQLALVLVLHSPDASFAPSQSFDSSAMHVRTMNASYCSPGRSPACPGGLDDRAVGAATSGGNMICAV
jgi:hypothetical protein